MRTRRLSYVTAPPSPDQSTEIRLLRVLVEAAQGILDGDPHANPLNVELFETGLYKSAVKREEARMAGSLFAPSLLVNAHPDVRAAIAQTNGLDLVLGWWEVPSQAELVFHPGIAGLTEQEARAWWIWIEQRDLRKVAEFMDRKRRTKQFGVSVEAAYAFVTRGQQKLAAVFGAAA